MKMIPALTCITICFFITPRSVNAQELGDTRQIRILIEDLDDPSRATGLSTESLRDLVLVGLKRGVPKLKVTEQITNAVLDVHITSSQIEYKRGFACQFGKLLQFLVVVVRPKM